MINYIYILIDPVTDAVRYVGKSVNPDQRYRKHISEAKKLKANNHKINWVKSLLSQNLKPKMVVIDSTDSDWIWLEEYWISQFITWGFKLVNGTNGGENPPSYKNKTHSDEYKEIRRNLMIINNPAKNMNKEWKNNISKALKKNGYTPSNGVAGRTRSVIQCDLFGNKIKTWDSVNEAAAGVGLKNISGIIQVCKNKRNHAGGFKWLYLE